MDALVGDRLVISSRRVGQPAHEGVIIQIMTGTLGREMFRVRWSDGHETIMSPGADAKVEHRVERGVEAPPVQTRAVSVDLRLEEDSEHCDAIATMRTAQQTFVGNGRARRHPGDPEMPMVGEELAIARSLMNLAGKLEEAARRSIAVGKEQPQHLVN